jgi:hypothetical protein
VPSTAAVYRKALYLLQWPVLESLGLFLSLAEPWRGNVGSVCVICRLQGPISSMKRWRVTKKRMTTRKMWKRWRRKKKEKEKEKEKRKS